MSWYEFRVSAINGTATGPPGKHSDPILTRPALQQIGVDASKFVGGGIFGSSSSSRSGPGGGQGGGGSGMKDSSSGLGLSGGGFGASGGGGAPSSWASRSCKSSVSSTSGCKERGGGKRAESRAAASLSLSRTLAHPPTLLYTSAHNCPFTAYYPLFSHMQVSLEIERSLASMAAWKQVFHVRHGRSPRAEDRDESKVRYTHTQHTQHSPLTTTLTTSLPLPLPLPHTHTKVLREEAHTLRVLRHAHAEAAIRTLDAERALVMKEQAVARIALKKWEKTHMAISGQEASDEQKSSDPKYGLLVQKVELTRGRLQVRCSSSTAHTHSPPHHSPAPSPSLPPPYSTAALKARKRAYAKPNAAGVALQQAAEEVDADEAMVQAAEDARRGKEDLHGGGGGGGGGARSGSNPLH